MTTDLAQRDCLFPTDNDLEIPTLSLDVQPKLVEDFGKAKQLEENNSPSINQ